MNTRTRPVGVIAPLLVVGAVLLVIRATTRVTIASAPQASAQTPRTEAPRDITGYWVSVVTEDWPWRMVAPKSGDYTNIPLNQDGRRIADSWDPASIRAGEDSCRPFGAAAIMRVPGRVRITWEDDRTLKIETDAGMQTRRFLFGRLAERGWRRINGRGEIEWNETGRDVPPPPGPATWQGYSIARWELALDPAAVRAVSFFPGGLGTGPDGAGQVVAGRYGSLHVVTTRMKEGYLRRNGVPYSEAALLTEDYDFRTEDDGSEWFTVTSIVEDPKYLSTPFVTTTDFRKEPDGSKWRPTSCSAY